MRFCIVFEVRKYETIGRHEQEPCISCLILRPSLLGLIYYLYSSILFPYISSTFPFRLFFLNSLYLNFSSISPFLRFFLASCLSLLSLLLFSPFSCLWPLLFSLTSSPLVSFLLFPLSSFFFLSSPSSSLFFFLRQFSPSFLNLPHTFKFAVFFLLKQKSHLLCVVIKTHVNESSKKNFGISRLTLNIWSSICQCVIVITQRRALLLSNLLKINKERRTGLPETLRIILAHRQLQYINLILFIIQYSRRMRSEIECPRSRRNES